MHGSGSHLSIDCGIDTMTEYAPGTTLAPGTYTRLAIHDDGPVSTPVSAMPYSKDSYRKPKRSARGPALARAYAIVREWGGDIAFFSEPFRVRLFLNLPAAFTPRPRRSAPTLSLIAEPTPEPVVETPVSEATGGNRPRDDPAGGRRSGHSRMVRKILRREPV